MRTPPTEGVPRGADTAMTLPGAVKPEVGAGADGLVRPSGNLADDLRAAGINVAEVGGDDEFQCPRCSNTARIVYDGTGGESPINCPGGCTRAAIREALSRIPDRAARGGTGPVDALEAARVDLVGLAVRPPRPRDPVPGAVGILLRGKRHQWVAPAGAGKSLAALVLAVQIVEAGARAC